MTDSQETPPRLSPPPKVGRGAPSSRADAAASRRVRADRGLLYWLTGLLFLALGATAFAVFVFLPDWVPEPAPAPGEAVATPSSEAETRLEPDANVADSPAPGPQTEAQASSPPPTALPVPSSRSPRPEARPEPLTRPADPTERAFSQAMTAGLARLDEGELSAAEEAFRQALTLRPGDSAASDGLARVDLERQLLTIADHRERARVHEAQERWSAAAAEYAAVLALDPTIRFAQEGQAITASRDDLNRRLEAHIAHPDRLSSDEALADAVSVLSEAGEIAAPGPVLTRQIERLTAQIRIAETSIPVVLLSDAETEVLVYRVGRLGTFERRSLELRPGSYTVVGTRPGYRDVRRTLEVTPGKTNISLTIRCEEKI